MLRGRNGNLRGRRRGSFSPETGPYSALASLRDRFMSIAFEVEPALEQSLWALYDSVLKGNPVWLTASTTTIKLVSNDQPHDSAFDLSPPSDKAITLARKTLEPWAAEHSLADSWCVEWIIEQKLLERWVGERGAAGVTLKIWTGPAPLERSPLSFVLEGWLPSDEGLAQFERRVRAQFEAQLASYCDKVNHQALALGYVPTPARREADPHLTWLARFQVKRESPADIWRSFEGDNRTRRAFEKAIRETATLLGLTLRS